MGGVETWRTNRKKVTEVLEYGLQAGLYSDVGFLVGPEKFRLNAHKNILMMRSEVFVAMFSEKWNTEGWTTVELVDNDPDTFKAFLRFVYTDELDDKLGLEVLLELMSLGKMYQFPQLLDRVAELLLEMIDQSNCVKIYEYARLLDEDVKNQAFDTILENLEKLLKKNAYLTTGLDGPWNFETFREILETDEVSIEEIDLFRAITKWSKGVDVEKMKEHVPKLLSLIRYPIMGSQAFREMVVPTNLLPKDDVIYLLVFFLDLANNDLGKYSLDTMKFKFRSRTYYKASDSEDLTSLLENASPGDVIQLLEKEEKYWGPFTIKSDFVTLLGHKDNILKGEINDKFTLRINARACLISNIKFEGGPDVLIQVNGDRNHLTKLTILNSSSVGLLIDKNENIIKDLKFLHLRGKGIILNGNKNLIEGLQSFKSDANIIVAIDGSKNTVRNMRYKSIKISDIEWRVGVKVEIGNGHHIEDLVSVDDFNDDTLLHIQYDVIYASVTNCSSGMDIMVDGKGHAFSNVNVDSSIEVHGSKHRFENCSANSWDYQQAKNIVFTPLPPPPSTQPGQEDASS